ncbi:MAG: hypothetical protein RSE13_21575 [Planktothrix sp. GU0601_MAG3]|nr:MAG: hypothetical protein RSE13_21575 [Planktothrix sp. GU0601_MAG3]
MAVVPAVAPPLEVAAEDAVNRSEPDRAPASFQQFDSRSPQLIEFDGEKAIAS